MSAAVLPLSDSADASTGPAIRQEDRMTPSCTPDVSRANNVLSNARETKASGCGHMCGAAACACDERAAIHVLFAECRTKAHALAPLPMLRLAEALAALAMLALPMMP